jgi:hypothetical protein
MRRTTRSGESSASEVGFMSREIAPEEVIEVLLADGWHPVSPGAFSVDADHYIHAQTARFRMGDPGGDYTPGFLFEEFTGEWVTGPLTSVLAVRYREQKAEEIRARN